MLSWPDGLCEALARGGRRAVRYDLRDPDTAGATAERVFDRMPSLRSPVEMANQMGMVFTKLGCLPRWRERLPELTIPTLVAHGRRDPLFPVGNGEALVREIPDGRLLVLDQAATPIPEGSAGEVAATMLPCKRSQAPRADQFACQVTPFVGR